MKQTVKLTESQLNDIIKNSVESILNENETNFKQVGDLNRYVQDNNLQMNPASKFQRVNAQSGKNFIRQYGKSKGLDKRQIGRLIRKKGAPLTTIASDGTTETNNTVTRNHTVLNNVGNAGNRWAVDNNTFNRKYERDTPSTYKPKGGPMNATQINEPISFTAPWGEQMNIDAGGYILQDPNNPNDIYGISQQDFDSTYRFINESQIRNIVRNVINEIKK